MASAPTDAPSPSFTSPVRNSNVPQKASGTRTVVQAPLPEEDSEGVVDLSVAEFWDALGYSSDDFQQTSTLHKYDRKEDFSKYMLDISGHICAEINSDQIDFVNTESLNVLQHPSGSDCRPSFVAVRSSMARDIHWSDVQAAIEIHSKGTNSIDGLRQAVAYAYFLLQARPDRVAVQGMYVEKRGVTLFLVSCTEIKRTQRLSLTEPANVQLLCAFVKRLYDPLPRMVDPTIRKRGKDSKGRSLFDLELRIPGSPPMTCKDYRILDCAPSRGQRTHIFVNLETPTIVKGQPVLIIKDQYRPGGRPFSEKQVIEHIHSDGDVPGIVRIVYAEQVYRADGSVVSSGRRKKIRICMVDFGTRMMDIRTPKEALMTIYDLLEATRFIYSNKQVLHRDISEGNVLFKQPLENMPEPIEKDKKEAKVEPSSEASVQTEGVNQPCFIGHLLDKKADRQKTSLLLVDFDRGDITNVNEKPHTHRTGTTLFMAKAIRKGRPHGRTGDTAVYKSVPQVAVPEVWARYAAAHPDRSICFPDSTARHFAEVGTVDLNEFRHELYHDAESAYWLLLRWALLAYPSGTPPTEISSSLWTILTGSDGDYRPYHIAPHSLNPGYRELEELLVQVGGIFKDDIYWATEEPYKHPDFAHEAFQRYILNFIIKNKDEEFMDHPKADNPRPCAPSLYFYSEVARTLPLIKGTFTSSWSSSQSSRPSPCFDDDPMPPPSSSRPGTHSTTADSSDLRMSSVPRSSSSLPTASSSASSVPTQSSGSSKRTRESERSEPELTSSKRARGPKPESDAAPTTLRRSSRKAKGK